MLLPIHFTSSGSSHEDITKITAVAATLAIGVSALVPVAALASSTSAFDPGVKVGPATNVTATSVVLHGAVNPDGHVTQFQFQCYVNPHEWNISATKDAGAGMKCVVVSAKLTGLKPGTTYTYRFVAQNANATSPTHWLSFTTRP
jgi:phosphodiesterase/alkaline phosphatase D-like protein